VIFLYAKASIFIFQYNISYFLLLSKCINFSIEARIFSELSWGTRSIPSLSLYFDSQPIFTIKSIQSVITTNAYFNNYLKQFHILLKLL